MPDAPTLEHALTVLACIVASRKAQKAALAARRRSVARSSEAVRETTACLDIAVDRAVRLLRAAGRPT